ncbi:putative nuclease HARBI1 [Strongylocentrotus purpuratus]|uniref:DDE Tnp4 domain-containing protein n=1 Tax=Strongylocentrotus purpuratus TaxID=7668 RepID=A0A7M7T2T6_STRPU|nr:putative nuclease HARBI1 [Strongylocentrotus purpuratus]
MAAILLVMQEEAARHLQRERVFRDRVDPLDRPDDELWRKYRFTRAGLLRLVDQLAPALSHPTARNCSLSVLQQLCVALNFYATGAVLDSPSTVHVISRATASATINKVSRAICITLKSKVIKFPQSQADVERTQAAFQAIAGFPRVVGCIDGTQIGLHGARLGDDEHIFMNRNGRYSMNVQLVCTPDYRISNAVVKWPGSTHDSRILQNSKLARKYHVGQLKGILLGDSGYPSRQWLMTPLQNPQSQAEKAYNNAHIRTRVHIEQVNGQLKQKFRCLLGHGLQRKPRHAVKIILSCCILYNLSKDCGGPDMEHEEGEDEKGEDEEGEDGYEEVHAAAQDEVSGVAARAEIIQYFAV